MTATAQRTTWALLVCAVVCGPALSRAQPAQELTCVACRDGFFLDDSAVAGGGDAVCRRCPVNMFTRPDRNASEQTHCLCNPGWSNSSLGVAVDVCAPCAIGLFKPQLGNVTCSACPADSSTPGTNSTALDACLCSPGFEPTAADEHVCAACAPGRFKGALADEACAECPEDFFCGGQTVTPTACSADSDSAAGSDAIFDCACRPGFSAVFATSADGTAHACLLCAAGKFNEDVNQTACADCPADTFLSTTGASNASACRACDPNAQAPAGSVAAEACVCDLGYAGVPGAPCEACLPGFYRENAGEYSCSACPTDTYNVDSASVSRAQCSDCPESTTSASGSAAPLDCVCVAGFRSERVGDANVCHQCAAGSFQPATNQTACVGCAAGTFSTAVGATAGTVCETCDAGFFTTVTGRSACRACAHSTYQDQALADPTAQPCTPCPAHSRHALNGSVDVTDCRCDAGYAQRGDGANAADPHRCELCTAGYYCPGDGVELVCPPNHYSEAGSAVCTECANNSQALADSIVTVQECKCVAGAEGTFDAGCVLCPPGEFQGAADGGVDACEPCAPGSYAVGRGNTACAACPGNASSAAGSDSETDCGCVPGFYGPAGGPCELCLEDHFCPGGSAIEACRAHAAAPEGSASQADCVCVAGYVSANATAACQRCPPDAYCPGGQAQEQCPDNSFSLAGASVLAQCDCDPGYWRECIVDTTTGLAVDSSGSPCVIEHARPCVLCGEDVVCANNTLVHCPANSTAPAGTSDAHDCVCEPGFKETAVLRR